MRPIVTVLVLAQATQAFIPIGGLGPPASARSSMMKSMVRALAPTTAPEDGTTSSSSRVYAPLLQPAHRHETSTTEDDTKPSRLSRFLVNCKRTLFVFLALGPFSSLGISPALAASSGGRMGGAGFRSGGTSTSRSHSSSSRSSSSSRAPSSSSYSYSYTPSRAARAAPRPATRPSSTKSRQSARQPTRRSASPLVLERPDPTSPYSYPTPGYYSPIPSASHSVAVEVEANPSPADILAYLALTGGVLQVVSGNARRTQGGDLYDPDAPPSVLGSGVTVLKLQVGLNVFDRRSGGSILGQLRRIAKTADVSSREGLAGLVSSVCMALLRSSDEWVSAHGESRSFESGDLAAEGEFQRVAIRERAKFQHEVDVIKTRPTSQTSYGAPNGADSTLAVVTLCVAIRGQSSGFKQQLSSPAGLSQALEALAADAMTEEGQNVLATEILWTPQDDTDVLTEQGVLIDYPELMNL